MRSMRKKYDTAFKAKVVEAEMQQLRDRSWEEQVKQMQAEILQKIQ